MFGMPNHVPEPKVRFSRSGMPDTLEPLFSNRAAPCAAPNEPSVTINGGIFAREINRPLSRPHAAPLTTATSRPYAITPQPAFVASPPETPFIAIADVTDANTSTEPTDRSMPDVMRHN